MHERIYHEKGDKKEDAVSIQQLMPLLVHQDADTTCPHTHSILRMLPPVLVSLAPALTNALTNPRRHPDTPMYNVHPCPKPSLGFESIFTELKR